ncbi:MAG: DUF4136 domain-containing protein [Tannerellaceae bacterium]|nr:DUF4136 domain-containing protein [Tannerellaceae bacterium]
MKKYFLLYSLILLAMISCQKDPDTSKLDNDFPVSTNYDKSAVFSSYSTFYIPDSVLVLDSSEQSYYWTEESADKIIDAFVRNMESRGYRQIADRDSADLGIQVSYVHDVNYVHSGGYYDDSYWWWGYPGYWGPGYWGGWGGWYYPYSVYYTYSVGSLLAEMVDLKSVVPVDENSRLPIIWTAYMSGLLSSSSNFNTQLAVNAVDQAFAQSSYIKK